MKKTTQEMKDTTKEMTEVEKNIDRSSTNLSDTNGNLYADMSLTNSWTVVNANLDKLLAYSADAGHDIGTTAESTRMQYAEAVVKSLFLQYWKGTYAQKDLTTLDQRFDQDVLTIFGRVREHSPFDHRVDLGMSAPFVPNAPDGFYMAIGAVGASLGENMSEFTQALTARGMKPFSLYDVIVQALDNRGQTERKELLPQTTADILVFKQDAIYMLQLRHNYLPMLVLG